MRKGGNYGWPEVYGYDHGDFTAPLRVYDEAIAPSGATFVGADDYLFATLRGEALHRLASTATASCATNAARGRVRPPAHGRRGPRRRALRAHEQPRRPRLARGRRRPDPADHAAGLGGSAATRDRPGYAMMCHGS